MFNNKTPDGKDICPQCYITLATHEISTQIIDGMRYHGHCATKLRRQQNPASYQMNDGPKGSAQKRSGIRM